MRPNLELVQGIGIRTGRDGILVNEQMETNIPDVYAAGDCVQFTSGITNEVISGKLATNAVPMGRVLADTLLGKKTAAIEGFSTVPQPKSTVSMWVGRDFQKNWRKQNGMSPSVIRS